MSTCNRLDLHILGSPPIMPKNIPDHPWLCVAKPLSNWLRSKDFGQILKQLTLVITILIKNAAATPGYDILHDMNWNEIKVEEANRLMALLVHQDGVKKAMNSLEFQDFTLALYTRKSQDKRVGSTHSQIEDTWIRHIHPTYSIWATSKVNEP